MRKNSVKIILNFGQGYSRKNTWEGKTAANILIYGWLGLTVFKLYGSLVFAAI